MVLIYRKTDFSVSLRIDINLYSWLKLSVREGYRSVREGYGKCKGGLQKCKGGLQKCKGGIRVLLPSSHKCKGTLR